MCHVMRQHAEHHQLAPAASVADFFNPSSLGCYTCVPHMLPRLPQHESPRELGVRPFGTPLARPRSLMKWHRTATLHSTVPYICRFCFIAAPARARHSVHNHGAALSLTCIGIWNWNGRKWPSPAQWLNGFRGGPVAAFILHVYCTLYSGNRDSMLP